MFIQTIGIEIDTEKSKAYGSIYTTAGSYSGANVRGQISPMVLNYECNANVPFQTINLYMDLTRQTINLYTNETCTKDIHIGGVVIVGDKCSCEILTFLQREDECLKYNRGFDSSFDLSVNHITETINTCIDTGEFKSDYDCEFNIGKICDENNDGNLWFRDGNSSSADGNIL